MPWYCRISGVEGSADMKKSYYGAWCVRHPFLLLRSSEKPGRGRMAYLWPESEHSLPILTGYSF